MNSDLLYPDQKSRTAANNSGAPSTRVRGHTVYLRDLDRKKVFYSISSNKSHWSNKIVSNNGRGVVDMNQKKWLGEKPRLDKVVVPLLYLINQFEC